MQPRDGASPRRALLAIALLVSIIGGAALVNAVGAAQSTVTRLGPCTVDRLEGFASQRFSIHRIRTVECGTLKAATGELLRSLDPGSAYVFEVRIPPAWWSFSGERTIGARQVSAG